MSENIDLSDIVLAICADEGLTLVNKVGEGTFKETFQVSDGSQNTFALKIYKSGDIDTRSEREIEVMLRCDHPGIAKILRLNSFEYQDYVFSYILEEFFAGGTLEHLVSNNGLLTNGTIIELGDKLINAISHFATQDLVHRDIKPANILFRKDSKDPIITDFGIVRDLQATSETMSWLPRGPGTAFFAAPEQLTNNKRLIDWRTDQFGLGVTLSLCTFGQHPFTHEGFNVERTVEEVAKWGKLSQTFKSQVQEAGLNALQNMVDVWPANRYRKPDQLLDAWNSQRK